MNALLIAGGAIAVLLTAFMTWAMLFPEDH